MSKLTDAVTGLKISQEEDSTWKQVAEDSSALINAKKSMIEMKLGETQ